MHLDEPDEVEGMNEDDFPVLRLLGQMDGKVGDSGPCGAAFSGEVAPHLQAYASCPLSSHDVTKVSARHPKSRIHDPEKVELDNAISIIRDMHAERVDVVSRICQEVGTRCFDSPHDASPNTK